MKKTQSKKKTALRVVISCLVLMLIVWWEIVVSIYKENFDLRTESYEPLMLRVEDFGGLERTKYEFPSNKGQMLTGYMYSSGEDQHGIIVIAHGFGGGGHNSYMDCADYFAKHGYYVFAYDATGNDESEGSGVGGVPQGVIDLDRAISFVEESGNFPELPISLFGHSWGGYSVCSVLNYHPEVKAVIECSGCDRSSDLFEAGGRAQAGNAVYAMMPIIRLYERFKFGKYAANTAMDGFEASDAAVMIVHSADDQTVPIEYGYDKFYEKYRDDPQFTFIRFEDRGHNYVYDDRTYIDEFNAEFDAWLETLNYDCNSKDNAERFVADKAEYIRRNLDRSRWSAILDEELFGQFVSFYDEHV